MNPKFPPRPPDARYLSLDAWRGAACLLLVIFHATFFAEMSFKIGDPKTWSAASITMRGVRLAWAGVPIFFVVSGYCIAASLDSLRRKPFTLGSYFARRMRRIYPPYWIMLLIGIVFMLVLNSLNLVDPKNEHLPHLDKFTFSNWLGNFTATEWWLHRIVGGERRMIMTNTWTLCYEEQFYLIMGLILALTTRRIFLATALVSIATIAARHYCRAVGLPPHGFFFDGQWLLFAAGILVYQRSNYLSGIKARLAEGVLVAGVLYGILEFKTGHAGQALGSKDALTDWYYFNIRHFGEYLIVAHLFALALVMFKRWDNIIYNHFLARPFLYCGRMSYSIYLSHYLPVIAVAALLAEHGIKDDLRALLITLPVCLAITFPISWLFYHFVERRFLNSPQEPLLRGPSAVDVQRAPGHE